MGKSIIDIFNEIEATGDLPSGFQWRDICWNSRWGWHGYIAGPAGSTSWIKVKKIPKELLDLLEE